VHKFFELMFDNTFRNRRTLNLSIKMSNPITRGVYGAGLPDRLSPEYEILSQRVYQPMPRGTDRYGAGLAGWLSKFILRGYAKPPKEIENLSIAIELERKGSKFPQPLMPLLAVNKNVPSELQRLGYGRVSLEDIPGTLRFKIKKNKGLF